MPKNRQNETAMPIDDGFLVRWTKEDRIADIPKRLRDAMTVAGAERAPLMRSLAIHWIKDIEENGPAQIDYAVATVNERPPAYGSKKKKSARK